MPDGGPATLACVAAAVFGLIGVVIGSLTSGIIQWHLQRRLEHEEGQAALRLLMTDFYAARDVIQTMRDTGARGAETTAIPLSAWDEYRRVLATTLDVTSWKKVEGAVLGLRHLKSIDDDAVGNGRSLSKEDVEHFERIGLWLEETIAILAPQTI